MSNYYYAMVFITVTMMVTSIIHLIENETLSRRKRNRLILISALIIIGASGEFIGIVLNSFPLGSRFIHGIIKAIEFTVAPIIPICYVRIVEDKNLEKKSKIVTSLLIYINTICELISVFVPFVFYINEKNVYIHGPYYSVYMISYFAGIIIFLLELLKYTRRYQSRNILNLISILVFLLVGFGIRIIDGSIYTDWMIVAITFMMFIMYYSDVSLKVDSLTHLFNRKSYEYKLKKLDYATAIILLDVNEFKQVNDKYGHMCGDNTLRVIAKTILRTYGKYAYCYRIGGDEFCVILKSGVIEDFSNKNKKVKTSVLLDGLNEEFDKLLKEQTDEYPMLENGVSKGYAVFNGLYDVESQNDESKCYTLTSVKETVKLADERMYEDKRNNK